ncbi:MAG: hypothetical protein R3C14_14570 [Caldilineaceae bacterium]
MILTLTPELESALHQEAEREGTTPEGFILRILQQNLPRYSPKTSTKMPVNEQQRTLQAIQQGKYALSRQSGSQLASDSFAARKQVEKELEERRWRS